MSSTEPATQPFFVADAPSYVERQADRELQAALRAGEYCYVLNSRQMGKSSLMVRTAERLKAAGLQVAVLDLTSIGQNLTPEQWYDGLLTRLGRQIGLEDELETFYQENTRLGPLQRFMDAIARLALEMPYPQITQMGADNADKVENGEATSHASHPGPQTPDPQPPLVIFVDEIDVTRSLPFSADEFFAAIRQCYIGRATDPHLNRLTICLLGTATPADLIQDTRTSPFNIGKRVEVKDFTPLEAAPLAVGLNRGELAGRGSLLLERVLYWTGGHPYLTQRMCRSAAEAGAVFAGDIDRLCHDLFLSHTAQESDDNLAFVRNRPLRSEADLSSLLDLYRKMRAGQRIADDETNPLCGILKMSGACKVEEGSLRVRNRIYAHVFDAQWVEQHLPDAEVVRQKAAYRAGILRAALIGGAIALVMAALAVSSLVWKNRADVSARVAHLDRDKALESARRESESEQRATGLAKTNFNLAETRKIALAGREKALGDRKKALDAALTQKGIAETSAKKEKTVGNLARSAEAHATAEAARAGKAEAKAKTEAARAKHILYIANMYIANMNLIQQAWDATPIQVGRVLELLRQTKGARDRGFEWGYWDRLCHLDLKMLKGHTSDVTSAAFSPDGKRIVTGSWDGTAKVWYSDNRDAPSVWPADAGSPADRR